MYISIRLPQSSDEKTETRRRFPFLFTASIHNDNTTTSKAICDRIKFFVRSLFSPQFFSFFLSRLTQIRSKGNRRTMRESFTFIVSSLIDKWFDIFAVNGGMIPFFSIFFRDGRRDATCLSSRSLFIHTNKSNQFKINCIYI